MGVRVYALAGSTITTFESTIVAVTREPGLVVIAIEPPDEVVEERREFFRLTDSMPVEVSIAAEASRITARTVDIGGGGVGILSPVLIEKGSTVTLHLELEDGPFAARSIVTRSVEVPDDHEALYRLGLSFERIDQQTQTRIVQFIFAKQREYRRKGVA